MMSSYSKENSDLSDRSEILLPSIGRTGQLANNLEERTGRRIGSPLVQERLSPANDWINSSPAFGGQPQKDREIFYPRPPSVDAIDQLRMYKEELAKRDRMIAQLASVETPRPRAFDSSRIDELYSNDRLTAAANAKSEAAILQVKVEGLQSQLRDAKGQVDIREDKLRELRLALETSKETEGKHMALVQSLRDKLVEYEAQMNILEGAATRSELAIRTLSQDNQACQKRILELESALRSNVENRKRVDDHRMDADVRLNNLTQQLSSFLSIDDDLSTSSPEQIVNLVKNLNKDAIELRSRLLTNEAYMRAAEVEQKANRETIIRLAAEAEKEKQMASQNISDIQMLRLDNENCKIRQRELERELSQAMERLEAAQSALTAARREHDLHRAAAETLDQEIRRRDSINHEAEMRLNTLKENLASVLFDGCSGAELHDESIRDRVQNLHMMLKDKTARIELLQEKLSDLTEELHKNQERADSAELERRMVEPGIQDAEERLWRAKNELAAGEVLRDELRADKEKFLQFLESLSKTLSMDRVTGDMGIDGATVAILARAEQVMKNESSNLVDRKTQIYNLQRQIKTLKDQADSKDLHMDLLRKKVTSLEERLTGKSELEREKDGEFVKNRKLVKLVEKYKCELNEAHIEIRDLKARLLRTSEIQTRSLQSDRRIEELEAKIAELEEFRQKQSGKIVNLEDRVKTGSHQTAKKDEIAASTIQALTSELRTTKQSLEETTKREHQLLELRQVISRMLGLDLNSLAIPDYELITRLEKLVLANQANAATAVVLDSAIADLGDGFRAGYHDAARSVAIATRSMNHPYRQAVGFRAASPLRRFEGSAY